MRTSSLAWAPRSRASGSTEAPRPTLRFRAASRRVSYSRVTCRYILPAEQLQHPYNRGRRTSCMSRFSRQSGVYLHPTALPGRHGIGSIGEPAKQFVDAAADAGQSLWQLCPLSPVAEVHGFSPYQAYSAFALEPLLIDLDDLVDRGLVDES